MIRHSVSGHIADFVVNHQFGAVAENADAELRPVMNLSLLDWCTVALAGTEEPVSQIVRQLVCSEGGNAQAFVFGETVSLPMRAAALANGTTSHALDYDDTHFLHVGHTSVAVLPAALAVAQAQAASGRAMIDAAIIGSEVACHVGNWLGRSHYQAGFHQTATAGTFGAVAAAARLLQLNREQTLHALGLASTRASGLKSQFGTMGKPFNAGMAAMNGVEAALLAAAGFESRTDGIDCQQGFAETHHAQPGFSIVHSDTVQSATDQDVDIQELGRHFVFADVQHKLHACCHGLHAAVEAMQELRDRHSILAPDIAGIHIRTNPRWIGVCDKPAPSTGLESKFSYGFVAAALFSGLATADLNTYSETNCSDSGLQAVMKLTSVSADQALTDTQSSVTLVLHDGRHLDAHHDIAITRPLPERRKAVLNKSAILLGTDAAEALAATVDSLHDHPVAVLVEQLVTLHSDKHQS